MSNGPVRDAEISRRRVVQGALWAAPAVVIATAVPAAANSTEAGTKAFMSGATYTVVASNPGHYKINGLQLAHTGGGTIDNITVTIQDPRGPGGNRALGTPEFTGAGWTLLSSAPGGTAFVFAYADPLAAGGVTTVLSVDLRRTGNGGNSPDYFTCTAEGNTVGGPVTRTQDIYH